MRRRNKVLAFVLAVMMVVGMLPISVFAAGGSKNSEVNTQTREEWIASQGGTKLFGSSFDNASKVSTSGDGSVSSNDGWNGTAKRTNAADGTTKVWVDTSMGALRLQANGTAKDYWPFLELKSYKEGDTFTAEWSLRFNKIHTGNLIYPIDRDGSVRSDGGFLSFIKVDDETMGIGYSTNPADALYTFKLGELIKISFTVDPVIGEIFVYANGEYVGKGYQDIARYNFNSATAYKNRKYPKYNECRFLQITGVKYADIELHELWVYSGTNIPYDARNKADASQKPIGQFIKDNGAKALVQWGFDDISRKTKDNSSKNNQSFRSVTDNPNGLGVICEFSRSFLSYGLLTSTYDIAINGQKIGGYFALRDENSDGYFLRLKSELQGNDMYFDTFPNKGIKDNVNKFVAGDTWVVSADVRVSTHNRHPFSIFNIAYRTSGRNVIAEVNVNAYGDIYMGSVAEGNGIVLGTVSSTEFTNIALIVNTKNNTYSVAVDGVVVAKDKTFMAQDRINSLFGGDSKKIFPNEIRTTSYASGTNVATDGYLDIDNYIVYAGANINNENFYGYENQIQDGWVKTAQGYWRYYKDGKPLVGTQVVDGKKYYFGTDGYYSELESDWLIDFSNIASFNKDFGATTKVHSTQWKYSMLMPDPAKLGMTASSSNIYGLSDYNIDIAPGGKLSQYINSEYVRELNERETQFAYIDNPEKIPAYPVKVFDFKDAVAIEVDWYTDKAVNLNLMPILKTPNWGKWTYPNYSKVPNMSVTSADPTGWRTDYIDLTYDSRAKVDGALTSMTPQAAISAFQLSFTWDNVNKDNYLDGVNVYIGNINVVKAKAVKTDVCPANLGVVRTVDGATYIYKDNMSIPNVGWVEFNGERYFANDAGVAVTGVNEIVGVNYTFDDNGKLVGNANGIYTINGKNYYYEDGVAKVGDFTVDGNSFSTKANGEIISMKGIIPTVNSASYLKPNFSTLSSDSLLDLATMTGKPTTGEGSYFGVASKNGILSTVSEIGNIAAFVKNTRFSYVEEADGNIVLMTRNESNQVDPFLQHDFGASQNADIVMEGSFKLGGDWASNNSLLTMNDRKNGGNVSYTVNLNADGFITMDGNIIGKLSTTEYTRVAMLHRYTGTAQNSIEVYVNGVKVYTKTINNAKFISPSLFRYMQYPGGGEYAPGTLYVDDMAIYKASSIVSPVDATLKNGLVNEGAFVRYYVNGVAKTGIQTVEVNGEYKQYVFDGVTAVGVDGFHSSGYYCIDGEVQDYVGRTNIGGKDYLFDASHKVVKNVALSIDPFNSTQAFTTDENGVIIAVSIVNSFDTSTPADIYNATPSWAKNDAEIVNDAENNVSYYDPKIFKTHVGLFGKFDGPDSFSIKDYDFIEFDVYVPEYFATNNGYFALQYRYKSGGYGFTTQAECQADGSVYNFKGKTGWQTVRIPIASLNQSKLGEITYIGLSMEGWYFTNNGTDKINGSVDNTQALKFAEARLVKYDEIATGLNGWINGRYYIEGIMQTGWFNFEGTMYYLDPTTGYKAVGIVKAPAQNGARVGGDFYYNFNQVGVCQGLADGIFADTKYVVGADGLATAVTALRIADNGELVSGIQQIDGNRYYVVPETLEVLTNSTIHVDTDGDGVYDEIINTGADGAIAPAFDKWAITDAGVYYYNASGILASGYTYVANDKDGNKGGYYYFDPATGMMLVSGWASVYGVDMFFGADGKAANGVTINTALSVVEGYMDNTGYFVEGVPATTEIINGRYKYSFVDGKLTSKVLVGTSSPEILVWIIKDGAKHYFYFSVGTDGFTKKFDSYACYTLDIYDISGGNRVKLDITDNTLVVAANSTSNTFEVKYTPVEHTYVENEALYQAPTCGAEGYKTYICSLCGASYKEPVAPTGEHTYGAWEIVRTPTCKYEGLKVAKCTGGCGTYKDEVIDRDPTAHRFNQDDEFYVYKAPTCTEDGYSSGTCIWCGESEDVTVLPATGHNVLGVTDWTEDIKATCITKGTEKGTCPDCFEVLTRETPVDPTFHINGNEDGIIINQADANGHFALFKVIIPSTCATPGRGIFRCLDCGGFVGNEEEADSLVVLDLDPDNHEFCEEYLVIFDGEGNVIETVFGSSREEMLANSRYLCGYSGEWRRDCHTESCKAEDGSYYYESFGTVNGSGAHSIDLTRLVTTNVTTDPLYGTHYYVCTKCEKAIQSSAHVMSNITVSADGITHIIYCSGGCIIEETGELYSETENCEHVLSQISEYGVVVGHAMKCECGHITAGTYVEHNATTLTPTYDSTHHWSYCADCGYETVKLAHDIVTVPGQTATCWQIGWDEYDTCHCGYVEEHRMYNQLPHNIPENTYAFDENGHWYACQNAGCVYKHLYEAHVMIHVDALGNTCTTAGNIEHDECAVCGWYDTVLYPDGVVIPATGHNPTGDYHYNETEHWRFCSNVINGVVCGAIIRENHTYTMDVDHFVDYDDEEGTAKHKCDTCEYKKPLTELATWWSVLGLTREGTAGNYSYYLLKNDGTKYTDYLALLADGSYRYFGADGKLVMTAFNNGNFDKITGFGNATNLITYPGYTDNKAAQRGAIANAIIDTADGIMMIKDGALAVGWTTVNVGGEDRDYFFNTNLGDTLVNTTLREGVLVKSTATSGDLTINALNVSGNAVIVVNVRADGSRKLGVVLENGKPYLYLDGTVGKMSSGWVTDTYTDSSKVKVYFVLEDKSLANGDYVMTSGGVYWNFNAMDDADYPCGRANEHCRNEISNNGIYINAEGKAASNELVNIAATGKTYFIVMQGGTQSVYKEKGFVLADGKYYVVDTANGEVGTFYTGWIGEDSYALDGALQVSTFCEISGQSYYFDADGNKIVSDVVYIKSRVEGESGFAWSFDADGVATRVDNTWVKFIGADGLVIEDQKGYYFDTQKGLAYGLQDGSIEAGTIYIFDDNGYLIVNVAEHDYRGVIYVIDENGKATVKEDEEA